MLLFVKQKTAYEMRISDWSSACALPILLELRHHGARERVELTVVAGVIGNRLGVGLEEVLGVRVLADARALSTLDQHLHGAVRQLQELQHGADGRSEEHTSELQSLMRISYAVFCLQNKKTHTHTQ